MIWHCVGYSGHFPSGDICQEMLPTSPYEDLEARRVGVCGCLWDGDTAYGTTPTSLLHLQHLLDQDWSCVKHFDGDFSLCYITVDWNEVRLFRSITSTRVLYYRKSAEGISWATNPRDLFPQRSPSLDAIDPDMVAILAATGLADETKTCYREIYGVPTGTEIHFLRDGSHTIRSHDYQLREDNRHLSYAVAAKRLREQIEAAVHRSLAHFETLDLLLSGGLDTSVIAYEASRSGKEVRGYHWTWDLPIFREEVQSAQAVAEQLHIPLHLIHGQQAIETGGTYLRSMQGTVVPYNHAFYHAFAQTIETLTHLHSTGVYALTGGHLGDTLFQGDWSDAFSFTNAGLCTRLGTLRNVFSWYKRGEAFNVFRYLHQQQRLADENPSHQRVALYQHFFTPEAFQQVMEHGCVDYRSLQSACWKQQAPSTREVAANLQSNLHFNAHLETALAYKEALPQHVVLRHPFSDRRLHEFCLSLGPHHRERWYAGTSFNKFLMRLAYVGDLPAHLIGREIRGPYAAVSQYFCLQNQAALRSLFDEKESLLVDLGIVNARALQSILASAEERLRFGQALVRMAGVELWLRGLAQRPLLEEAYPLQAGRDLSQLHPDEQSHSGLMMLAENVIAKTIQTSCILIQKETLTVARIDETDMIFWLALQCATTWDEAIDLVQKRQPPGADREQTAQTIFQFADELTARGWIVLTNSD